METEKFPGLTDWPDELVAVRHPLGTRALAAARRYQWAGEQRQRAVAELLRAIDMNKNPIAIRHARLVERNWDDRLRRIEDQVWPLIDRMWGTDRELCYRVSSYIFGGGDAEPGR
ncbi:hypothetical protein [Actinomadura sp. K4S16]|uniref:hypothetical protein n=1 Tax=Actinomadura sp. K4S16 TaxID=1316147 RepID=UPI0011EE9A51|nr:hypothetical protein [Actinomadura sp. K4S16]